MKTKNQTFFDVEVASQQVGLLQRDADTAKTVLEDNRKLRRGIANVASLRERGDLLPHETYISVRLIDANITRALPPHLAYLKQSKRLAIFTPNDARLRLTGYTTQYLEEEFSRVLMYQGWEEAHICVLDAAELHGLGWYEVCFDETKPGHVAINSVPNEELLYNPKYANIQDARLIARKYTIGIVEFNTLVKKYSKYFDEKVTGKIREHLNSELTADADSKTGDEKGTITLYKVYFKESETNVVYCGWYCKQFPESWLAKPQPFYNGVDTTKRDVIAPTAGGMVPSMEPVVKTSFVPRKETKYPYVAKRFRITESRSLDSCEGRGMIDYYKQDAASSTWSSFVNGCIGGAITTWVPENPNPEVGGTAPKQLNVEMKHGAIWDRPMKPFNPPYPDPMLPKCIEMLTTQNAEENAQIAWAVEHRKDSVQKTATEIEKSSQMGAVLSSVDVLMTSLTLGEAFDMAWQIVQSQSLQGLIVLCPDETGNNRVDIIEKNYIITPAGDKDFIEREQNVRKMREDIPVFAQTALAQSFLEEYIKIRYPTLADKFITELKTAQVSDKQLIASMAQLLQTLAVGPDGQLNPELAPFAEQLKQLQQRVQQSLSQGGMNAGQLINATQSGSGGKPAPPPTNK